MPYNNRQQNQRRNKQQSDSDEQDSDEDDEEEGEEESEEEGEESEEENEQFPSHHRLPSSQHIETQSYNSEFDKTMKEQYRRKELEQRRKNGMLTGSHPSSDFALRPSDKPKRIKYDKQQKLRLQEQYEVGLSASKYRHGLTPDGRKFNKELGKYYQRRNTPT